MSKDYLWPSLLTVLCGGLIPIVISGIIINRNKLLVQKKIPLSLKLYYFDIPGKGEAIRLLCAHYKIPLEDIRLTREEFLALKENGVLKFGQLPALAVTYGDITEDIVLVQSAAIMRYLGKVYSAGYPSDPVQSALVDSIIDEENDLFTGLSVSRYQERFGFGFLQNHKDLLEICRKNLNDTVLPRHLQFLNNICGKSKSGWICNTSEPSIADFILVPRLKWLASGANDGISKDILLPYNYLNDLIKKFSNLDTIQKYYTTHEEKA